MCSWSGFSPLGHAPPITVQSEVLLHTLLGVCRLSTMPPGAPANMFYQLGSHTVWSTPMGEMEHSAGNYILKPAAGLKEHVRVHSAGSAR